MLVRRVCSVRAGSSAFELGTLFFCGTVSGLPVAYGGLHVASVASSYKTEREREREREGERGRERERDRKHCQDTR